jgi:membrane protein YqaA with SNARE-associated domain
VSERKRLTGWRLTAARVLALVAVVGISAGIYLIRDQVDNWEIYGYPGIFVLSLLSNATLVFPAPSVALTFAFGAVLNPVGVALAAGAGAALGEMTGYLVGFSSQGVIERTAVYDVLEGWTIKFGGWLILVLAFIPNPLFDIAGAVAGAMGMHVPSFLFWTFVGKTLKMLLFALAGAAWLDPFLEWFGGFV